MSTLNSQDILPCPDVSTDEGKSETVTKRGVMVAVKTFSMKITGDRPAKNRLLVLFWILALIISGLIANRLQSTSQQFFGIAGSMERSISFQYPVEIVDISVVEGSKVDSGEMLLEVRRYDLASNLAIVEDEIAEITVRKNELMATTVADVKRLEAEKRATQSELDIQIAKVESQLALNAKWTTGQFKPAQEIRPGPNNVLVVKLTGLKQQRKHSTSSYQATIDNLRQQLSSRERPADAKLAVLSKRKQELQRQVASLKVNADFAGSVGSVLFTKGEQVPMFSPILTLQGESTSFIKAYIHEAVLNEVEIGQKVWIESLTAENEGTAISGRVESLGNRIVEYPERLKRNPLVSAWGREVVIELEERNSLLLGEKVAIFLGKPKSWVETVTETIKLNDLIKPIIEAVHAGNSTDRSGIYKITSKGLNSIPVDSIEASGLVWDSAAKTYWMVSDEKYPLFEFDSKGQVVRQIDVDGLKIDDVESISIDKDSLYIAASVSVSKSGAMKNKRKKLVQLEREDKRWVYHRELNLYEVIRFLSKSKGTDEETRRYLRRGLQEATINIEAIQVRDNTLYLGFKTPLNSAGQSIILKIDDLESLFSGAPAHAKIWKSFRLIDESSRHVMTLSDMLFQGNKIYLTGVDTFNGNSSGGLWELDVNSDQVSYLQSFVGYRAEGIAVNSITKEAILVFDGGRNSDSYYTHKYIPQALRP